MPQLRKDLITGDWVIIATERAKRPDKFKGQSQVRPPETNNATCPFCAGNEDMTPQEVFTIDKVINRKPNQEGWQVRVVPNKFPALISKVGLDSSKIGIYDVMSGFGVHEVIILTPQHIRDIGDLSHQELVSMVTAYKSRIDELKKDDRIKSVIIMHNQGKEAGASLDHTHSQLFGLPFIPPVLGKELRGTIAYFNDHDRCAMCDILEYEQQQQKRIVYMDQYFMVLQPFASGSPYETWVVPRQHSPNFEDIDKQQMQSFCRCLKLVLDFFYHQLDNPAFNYYIHTSPTLIDTGKYYHWHLELIPKLTIKAGFEMGTGVNINITTPEFTAEYIKERISIP
ncbi:MAG: galactose-1-phosphate uridylyltransferase [Actinomycetia bacterium]|nr:galactose-1-phosphate uridylyltransferase [Actinomycetes bacterium]